MRYQNRHIIDTYRTFWDVLLWKLGTYDDPLPKLPPPLGFQYPAQPHLFERHLPSAIWIGHSTFLIEIDGLFILTDPVWEDYCSPIPIPRLKRQEEPAIPLADLPPIDIVLISHNHYDHLDAKTVRALHQFHPQIEWIVPERLSSWFRRRGIDAIELSWWKTHSSKKCAITAVPAQHFSGRTIWDQNRTHWNGYVVETPQPRKRFYFTGDTGYNRMDFKSIGDHWPYMDLSLIPIGTYSPKKFMAPVHIGPHEAVLIHKEVHSRLSLGMHWKTFRLSDEPIDRPPYDLYLAMKEHNLPFKSFMPVDIGHHINW
ncbi:MAG TPA: MBL fold metallo-hydrolase [Chlamydiales bacterium]|nr:MBL fold metallo-hydrolase [Chlamydiales bacterium]